MNNLSQTSDYSASPVIELVSNDKARLVLQKEYGQFVRQVRFYVCQIAQLYVLGYKSDLWRLIQVDNKPVFCLGEKKVLVHGSTFAVYQFPSELVGIALTSVAIEHTLDLMIGELSCDEYGELYGQAMALDSLGEDVSYSHYEPDLYQVIKSLLMNS